MSANFMYGRDSEGNRVITIMLMDLGKSIDVNETNANFADIVEALKTPDTDDQEILDLYEDGIVDLSFQKALSNFDGAAYNEETDEVYYNGEVVHNSVANAIRDCHTVGLDISGHLKFLENLMENPSKHSVDQLYNFLEKNGLTITEDGCFLAYKVVKDDYDSVHTCHKTGKAVNWAPGTVVSMQRNRISDDPHSHCSEGLHVGSLDYTRWFYNGRTVLVKVNPRDVVSVPNDLNTKIRVCEAKVIRDYVDETVLPTAAVYSGDSGEAVYNPQMYGTKSWDDDDWDDFEDLDDYDEDEDDDDDDEDYGYWH
jgi:hypothetical protein